MTESAVDTPAAPARRIAHAADIQAASSRVSKVMSPTPLQYCERLSEATGARVFLKREDLQYVRSYKIRGAFNAISQLDETQRAAGVIAASAGNHAQGVAYACKHLGIHGRIFVPEQTPRQKRDRIAAHGGDFVELVVTGDGFDAAAAAAQAEAERTGATVVHPFDDFNTICGQGTVALEIIAQLAIDGYTPDVVVIPVGGAGLLAGMASYFSDILPTVRLIGAEPEKAASLQAALAAGKPVTLENVEKFVDGAAVARIGDNSFAMVYAHREMLEMTTVSDGAICEEMLNLYQNEGIIAEPAGAVAPTALHNHAFAPGEIVVCVISGGNNDVSRYDEIIERSLIHQGLKHYFLVEFPQKPGQLRRFLDEVLGADDDIVRFEYLKRNNRDTGTALVGLLINHRDDLPDLLTRMEQSPLSCTHLTPGTPEYSFLLN